MLPGIDGFEVCRRIRAAPEWPAPRSSCSPPGARPSTTSSGLELGADDYLAKPFDPRELLARIRAVLRRGGAPARPARRACGGRPRDRLRRARGDGARRARAADPLRVRSARGAGPRRRPRALARLPARRAQGPGVRGLRPLDRRARLAAARQARADPKEPRYIRTVRGVGYVLRARRAQARWRACTRASTCTSSACCSSWGWPRASVFALGTAALPARWPSAWCVTSPALAAERLGDPAALALRLERSAATSGWTSRCATSTAAWSPRPGASSRRRPPTAAAVAPGGWWPGAARGVAAAPVRDPRRRGRRHAQAAAHRRFGGPAPRRPRSPSRSSLLVVAVATRPLARRMSRPLERLTEAARRLGAGDLAARAPAGRPRRGGAAGGRPTSWPS